MVMSSLVISPVSEDAPKVVLPQFKETVSLDSEEPDHDFLWRRKPFKMK